MSFELDKDYGQVLQQLKKKIRQARLKAAIAVNKQLLSVYWEIGNTILQQQKKEGWGTKVIDRLIVDLKTEFPDMKGLSPRNIKYMRAFAEAYPRFLILQPAVAKLEESENKSITILQGKSAKLKTSKNQEPIVQDPLAQLQLTGNEEDKFVQQSVAQLPWGHNCTLLDKLNQPEERFFYAQKAVANG